jgi:ABC-type sugar transport system ATPase subunit
MSEISIEHLSKVYGKNIILDDVSFSIKSREFMVMLGPSGCGKTTTLLTIAGLERPTGGRILFDGKDVTNLDPKERNVAMVFQEYALYPHMSVFNNIALCLKVDKVPKAEAESRVKQTADLLEIKPLLDRKPGQLSGGEQQRVALGRAIVRNPSVYLMDEPLSNLDAILRAKMRVELKDLHEKLKITTVYVTHDQAEAMMLSDRIAVICSGKLIQLGEAREIYDSPSCKFIAEFVGSPPMNFVDISLKKEAGKMYLDSGSFSLELDASESEFIAEKASGSELILGIRPQDVSVTDSFSKGVIEAKVHLIQWAGDVALLTATVDSTILIVQAPRSFSEKAGGKIYLKIDKERMHIFNKDGETIL